MFANKYTVFFLNSVGYDENNIKEIKQEKYKRLNNKKTDNKFPCDTNIVYIRISLHLS